MTNLSRKSYATIRDMLHLPTLIEIQLTSFQWFCAEGLGELLQELSLIHI